MFLFAVLCGFMMPGMIEFDDGGKNYFTIYLNESKIGATDSRDTIDEVMAQARRIIAGESTELIYAKMDLEVEGKEVLAKSCNWGIEGEFYPDITTGLYGQGE